MLVEPGQVNTLRVEILDFDDSVLDVSCTLIVGGNSQSSCRVLCSLQSEPDFLGQVVLEGEGSSGMPRFEVSNAAMLQRKLYSTQRAVNAAFA